MEKKKKASAPLFVVVIFEVISLVLPFAAGFYALSVYSHMPSEQPAVFGSVVDQAALAEAKLHLQVSIAVFVACVIQFVVMRGPLKKLHGQAILNNEYDEFGVSKKKRFENLSRQEREEIDRQKAALREQLLPTSVMKKITKKGSEDPDKDLKELIGLANVKSKVSEMTARMKFEMDSYMDAKKNHDKNAKDPRGTNGRHMVFYGNPGTGKTTVARIIAGYLYKYGYIKENKCIEINGGFLKEGEHTEEKTKLIIQEAYGGVLFIDEAYSIVEGNANYGKAAVATLIKEMEDNRDRFTVILAGYRADMKHLLDQNEGFKSRVKEYLEFPDYNAQEMNEMFVAMAHSAGFVVDAGAINNYETRIAKERQLSSFGNGRTARNVLDESIDKHAVNYGQGILTFVDENGTEHDNQESRYVLRACDISTVPNKQTL